MKYLLLFTLVVATTSGTLAQSKTIKKNFKDIKVIRLNASSGDITLRKSTGKDVDLTLTYSYDDEDFKPQIEDNNGTLTLKEEFSSGSHSGSSNWTLTVPDNTRVSLNSGSGDVTLDDLSADVKTNLGSGDISMTSVKGNLDFNTGSGSIELTSVSGDVSLNTGSGNITALDSNGDFSFNAGSGDIKLNNMTGDLSVNTGSGDIEAKKITLTAASKFNTGSGDATISLGGAALDFNISVNSGSGDATLNFNGAPISGEVIMTANARNGRIVAPFKFDKEETITDGNSPRIEKTAKLGDKQITIRVGTGSGTAEIGK
jgi:DUF4097 and DUF4098 domain-containing protein YvlB